MFTGLVECSVHVTVWEPRDAGARLVLPVPEGWDPGVGDSIAVSGVCLTVVEGPAMSFDLSAETLARTWFGHLAAGAPPAGQPRVNLERPLRLGDRLDGHLVAGHVDGLGEVVGIEDVGDGGREIEFEVAEGLERYLVEKGSVTLDGISLTVVEPRGRRFKVAVIPKTLELTNLGGAGPGRPVNVEVDLVGKWVERFVVPGARES